MLLIISAWPRGKKAAKINRSNLSFYAYLDARKRTFPKALQRSKKEKRSLRISMLISK
jgi:hypothetical protein